MGLGVLTQRAHDLRLLFLENQTDYDHCSE